MPSSPSYKRDYTQEYKTAKSRGENGTGTNSDNAKRQRLRREMVAKGKVKPGDGKDVDHKKALNKGGANTTANARVTTPSINRSFSRNPDGSMKQNDGARRQK
jgi:hypothetical protein